LDCVFGTKASQQFIGICLAKRKPRGLIWLVARPPAIWPHNCPEITQLQKGVGSLFASSSSSNVVEPRLHRTYAWQPTRYHNGFCSKSQNQKKTPDPFSPIFFTHRNLLSVITTSPLT